MKVLKGIFIILATIGLIDMSYQAFTHDDCGPIKRVLTAFFPDAPGACGCETGESDND